MNDCSNTENLLQMLVSTRSYLVEHAGGWLMRRDGGAEEEVNAALIEGLRAKGHLAQRPGGGLEPLAIHRQRSDRFGDQRPDREGPLPASYDAESPLAWLRSRKDRGGRALISAEQFLAGEKLRGDYELSRLERRVTVDWGGLGMGQGGGMAAELTDSMLDARRRVQKALDAVGPELASILIQVCCLSAGVEQAERILELPARSGKAVLGLALKALSRHYGLTGPKGRAQSAHWARDGYRPAIALGAS